MVQFLYQKKHPWLFLEIIGDNLQAEIFSSWGEQGLLSSCGARASPCGGFSCCRAWALGVWASAVAAQDSVVVAQGLSCPEACGILDEGSNLCPLNWQVDS